MFQSSEHLEAGGQAHHATTAGLGTILRAILRCKTPNRFARSQVRGAAYYTRAPIAGIWTRLARRATEHHAIEPQQAEDRQRLVAQAGYDDLAALGANALVERHDRSHPGAVDHAQGGQVH